LPLATGAQTNPSIPHAIRPLVISPQAEISTVSQLKASDSEIRSATRLLATKAVIISK